MGHRRGRGRPPHDDLLTPAEWRVVDSVRHGMSNALIAARQGVSTDAIKFHVANAVQKLGFSSRRELRDWNGVRRDSNLHEEKRTMDASLGPIGQISRNVRDIAEATRFYGEQLRLPHLYTFGNLAFFDCNGVRLFLSENEGEAGPESVLYFRVGDIRSAHEELAGRGLTFTSAPHMIHKHADGTEEWMAFFNDPESRPLAIMAQARAAAPAASTPAA
jgi:DNA-binding CsgD family transcriptional regulator/catechol 2,3-dioxygenase-like lactoylglutathione lyase family enzyme